MSIRRTIDDFKKIAKRRGGICLSTSFSSLNSLLRFSCKKGHIWETKAAYLIDRDGKPGTWCPDCAPNKKLTLKDLHIMAKSRRGKCLAKKYVRSSDKVEWECKQGHRWFAASGAVLNGTWCPRCAGNAVKTIEEMNDWALKRGGVCVSKKYMGIFKKLKWKCSKNHSFEMSPQKVKRGQWCSSCDQTYIGETITRIFIEAITGKKFPRSYPAWLISSNGTQLELDGYSKTLKIAFEHHGEQHFSANPYFFSKKTKTFEKRLAYDSQKRRLCRENGVHLIEIPELFSRTRIEDLQTLLVSELLRAGCPRNNVRIKRRIHWERVFHKKNDDRMLQIQRLIEARGGRCLSPSYINSVTKMQFRCASHHTFLMNANKVKEGSWCPKCYENRKGDTLRLELEDAQSMARKNGGLCLATKYINARSPMLWQCKCGHKWWAPYGNIARGSWCRPCRRAQAARSRRYEITKFHRIAKKRGGKLRSKKYLGILEKHEWECRKGHRWMASASNVLRGTWCPTCAHLNRTQD